MGNHGKWSQSGQSLVEMGLMLMLLLWLLAGAVDFGMAFFTTVALRDAAQEGALYGALNPPIPPPIPSPIPAPNPDDGNYYDCVPPEFISGTWTYPFSAPYPIVERVQQTGTDVPIDLSNAEVYCKASATCVGGDVSVKVEYDYPIMTPLISSFLNGGTIRLSASATSPILKQCP